MTDLDNAKPMTASVTPPAPAPATASAFGVGRLKPGSLQVTVGAEISKQNLHDLIGEITRLHGCYACGLIGLDLVIRTQDPLVHEAFKKIDAVKDVAIYR